MTDEQFQQLVQIIEKTGSHAYQEALNRTLVGASIFLVIQVFALVAVIYAARRAWKFGKREMDANNHDGDRDTGTMAIVASIAACLFVVPILGFLADSLISIASPGYGALKLLSDLVVR